MFRPNLATTDTRGEKTENLAIVLDITSKGSFFMEKKTCLKLASLKMTCHLFLDRVFTNHLTKLAYHLGWFLEAGALNLITLIL